MDAALKPVAADKDHRLETDDENSLPLRRLMMLVHLSEAHRDDFIEGPVLRNIKSHVVHKCSTLDGRTLCNRLTSAGIFWVLSRRLLNLERKMLPLFQGPSSFYTCCNGRGT